MDDDDEVVEEFEVFLAKGLSKNIYLLQYPVIAAERSYTSDQRLVARVKPEHKKIELEVLLDVSSPNYDQSKGEQIALNVDGGSSGEGMTYENSVMDTQVLSSKCIPQLGKRYVAALMQDKQVHLTPVSQIMQMQPSFKYMDRAEMRALHVAKMKAQVESGNSSQDEAEDAKAVTVRVGDVENEAAKAARENSYASYEKRLQEEKWISATVHHKDDTYSNQERKRLLCGSSFHSSFDESAMETFTEMSLSAPEYLKSLVPKYIVSDVDSSTTPDNVLSLAKLESLSLGEQLKALMKSANIIHFSHLLTLLPGHAEENSVVRSLQSFAVLIQGCWIVKSEILYPAKSTSSLTGVPAETMCKVRDYILCLFTKHDYLVRRDISKQLHVPGEEIKAIFDPISRMKAGHGWHLRLPPDTQFNEKFSEVAKRQNMLWAARFKQQIKPSLIGDSSEGSHSRNTSIPKSGKRKEGTTKSRSVKSVRVKESMSKNKNKMTDSDDAVTSALIAPLQAIEPMDYELTNAHETARFMELSNDADTVLPPSVVDPAAPNNLPFIKPEAVGIDSFASSVMEDVEQRLVNIRDSHSTNDQVMSFLMPLNKSLSNVNMDGINSTIALVTDQMRKQQDPLFFKNVSSDQDRDNSKLPEYPL